MNKRNRFGAKPAVKCCTKLQTKYSVQLIRLGVFLLTFLVLSNIAFAQSAGTQKCGTTVSTPIYMYDSSTGKTTITGYITSQLPPCPSVTGVSPSSGSTSGGYAVSISVTSLWQYQVTAVYFGGKQVSYSYTSTGITVTAPSASSAGTVPIYIYTSSNTATGSFTYNAAPKPTITSVSPPVGPTTGGTKVTIYGTNLIYVKSVDFGDGQLTDVSTSVNGNEISGTTPASTEGSAEIVVNTNNGIAVSRGDYTYLNPPVINGITPDYGPLAGGNTVTISGSNLDQYDNTPDSIYVGDTEIPASDYTVNGQSQITLKVPSSEVEGPATVTINYPYLPSATYTYEYAEAKPTLVSESSNKGPLTGGTIQIDINDPNPNNGIATVEFESTPATINSQSVNGDMRDAVIEVPPSASPMTDLVTIVMNDGTVLSFQYEYTEGPNTAATLRDPSGKVYLFGDPTTASEIDATLACVPSTESGAACSQTYYCIGQGGSCTPDTLYKPGSTLAVAPISGMLPQHIFLCFYSTDTDGTVGATQCQFVDFESSTLPMISVTGVTTNTNGNTVSYDFAPQTSANEVDVSLAMNPSNSQYELAACILTPGAMSCEPTIAQPGGSSSVTLTVSTPQELSYSGINVASSNIFKYTGAITVTEPGTNYVCYALYDPDSLQILQSSFICAEVIIQPPAPVTLASATDSSGDYAFGTWTKSPFVNVLLTCTRQALDATSCGIRYCTYTTIACTPSGGFSSSTEVTVPFSEEGISHINYQAEDNAVPSNLEQTETQSIQIDTTPPTTVATARTSSGVGYTFGTLTAYLYVAVSLSCSDSDSGCGATLYCTDTTNTCTPNLIYSSPVTIGAPLTSYIRFLSVDLAGNVENVNSRKIVLGAGSLCGNSCPTGQVLNRNCTCVVGGGPITTASAKTSSNANYAFGTSSSTPFVNVYLSCSDPNGPGCDETSYCADSANACIPSNIYSSSAPIQIAAIGTSYIRYRSNDTAGNLENIKSGGVIINGTLYTCPNTCFANQIQVPYPNCACVYIQSNNTCTNTCLANQTQMLYPNCNCTSNILNITNATCINSCPANETQLPPPACSCLISTCTNTCPANETQLPPPVCSCILPPVNFSDYCLSTCSLRGCPTDKCQVACAYQGDQFLSACNNICQSAGGSYLACSLECGVAQNEINKASDCYSNCTLNSSAYECGQTCGINDYITMVGGCSGSNVTITGVTPSNGSTVGGDNVVVTGTNLNGTMAVTFGITSASIVSVSPTQLVITSPVHPVGTVDVVAVTPSGTAIDPSAYTYYTPPCVSNWQCSDWSTCSNGVQTRVCNDANSCGNTTNKPSTSRSCTVTCVPSWNCTYSGWSSCSNGLQTETQTCVDSNKCNSPYTIASNRTCSLNCTSNWNCTDNSWTSCSNGLQTETQTCIDLNKCSSSYTAAKSQPCTNNAVTPGGGGSIVTNGNVVPPSLRTQENITIQRKVSPIFILLNRTLQWESVSLTTCIRGAACVSSDDCCGAPCSGGYCLCSVKSCLSSGECCSGYCENGECTTPSTNSVYLFSKPMQGCSGLIDECFPGEGGCIAICDGLTALMLISSVGAGFVAWNKYNHPVSGIIAAVIPILTGMMLYTFVGIIVAITVIAMLAYFRKGNLKTKESKKSKSGEEDETQ